MRWFIRIVLALGAWSFRELLKASNDTPARVTCLNGTYAHGLLDLKHNAQLRQNVRPGVFAASACPRVCCCSRWVKDKQRCLENEAKIMKDVRTHRMS